MNFSSEIISLEIHISPLTDLNEAASDGSSLREVSPVSYVKHELIEFCSRGFKGRRKLFSVIKARLQIHAASRASSSQAPLALCSKKHLISRWAEIQMSLPQV